MDPLSLLLLSDSKKEQDSNKLIYSIVIISLVIPLVNSFIGQIKESIFYFFNYIYRKINTYIWKTNIVEYTGSTSVYGQLEYNDFPIQIYSVCDYLCRNKLAKNVRSILAGRNSYIALNQIDAKSIETVFIIEEEDNIVVNDLIINFRKEKISNGENSNKYNDVARPLFYWKITMSVTSRKLEIKKINDFVTKCIIEYTENKREINKNKIYHFIYQGFNNNNYDLDRKNKLSFSKTLLNDSNNIKLRNGTTFDKLFSPNNEIFKKDIKRLNDIEYYRRTGLRRKKGYLFYGFPGTGKTASVQAISNEDKRHIIEIPFSRLRTNKELELLMNITEIDGIEFTKNEIILLFEEIDIDAHKLKKRNGENDCIKLNNIDSGTFIPYNNDYDNLDIRKKQVPFQIFTGDNPNPKDEMDDELNLATILTRFDGICDYDGIIIICTTNFPERISPALYRDGRLNPIFFDYMDNKYIVQMIENFYNIKLTEEQQKLLPDKDDKIVPTKLIRLIETNEDSIEDLLNSIVKLVNNDVKEDDKEDVKEDIKEDVKENIKEDVKENIHNNQNIPYINEDNYY